MSVFHRNRMRRRSPFSFVVLDVWVCRMLKSYCALLEMALMGLGMARPIPTFYPNMFPSIHTAKPASHTPVAIGFLSCCKSPGLRAHSGYHTAKSSSCTPLFFFFHGPELAFYWVWLLIGPESN